MGEKHFVIICYIQVKHQIKGWLSQNCVFCKLF